jgi:2-desacetyl-2-hydroxyethyl bacteriochlorophyllide A dehydrogenase
MSTAMAAASVWFPRARCVEIRKEMLPSVGPDDVRIRALASGVSQGTEMLVYRGQVPPDLGLDLPTLRGSFAFPIKYGYASVGRVVQMGREVTRVREGDLVFVHHPHQTEYVVSSSLPLPLPPDLPAESGTFFANAETAFNVVLDAHPHLGERVVVFGQGVVGLLITQLLRRAGAGLIIAVEPAEQRRALAGAVGADVSLAPDSTLSDAVREMTGGLGVDLAIEASGNPAALRAALESVAREGTVVVCSWYGTKPVDVPLGGPFHRGRLRLVSSQVGSLSPVLQPRWTMRRRAETVRALLPQLQLSPLISHRIPFAQAADAYDRIDRNGETTVQVVLTYGDQDV